MTENHIEDRHVEVPGGRTFVRQWTPPLPVAAAPLILLHDSLGSVEQWRDFPARPYGGLKTRPTQVS